ncbi:hypothetical protein [Sphingomonas pokkalii]|uniref:Uncharacterized protein n=1 Tax=Sphingomonas pokkalii TaxID=2175090 RepID=A0A2U0SA00_9SPHN|nr:hypothetical protein [Sphingomonas pokkalii]PVX28149.1 hypothetical protein DD559_01295 [Sphingomonas pokkalii]
MHALALVLLLLPQLQVRGPVADDDGTGRTRQRGCRENRGDEIVVCRRADPNGDRLGRLPDLPRRRGFVPAVRLPDGSEARAGAVPHDAGIAVVPAAMVTLRIPLGRHKKKPQADQK